MNTLVALLAPLVRMVRPSRGLHVMPLAERLDILVPTVRPAWPHVPVVAQRRTALQTARAVAPGAARIRPYAAAVGAYEMPDAHEGHPVDPAEVDVIRPYVRLWENAREQQRADATRLGVAVLAEAAEER